MLKAPPLKLFNVENNSGKAKRIPMYKAIKTPVIVKRPFTSSLLKLPSLVKTKIAATIIPAKKIVMAIPVFAIGTAGNAQ